MTFFDSNLHEIFNEIFTYPFDYQENQPLSVMLNG